jgi:hypothetical protein
VLSSTRKVFDVLDARGGTAKGTFAGEDAADTTRELLLELVVELLVEFCRDDDRKARGVSPSLLSASAAS